MLKSTMDSDSAGSVNQSLCGSSTLEGLEGLGVEVFEIASLNLKRAHSLVTLMS